MLAVLYSYWPTKLQLTPRHSATVSTCCSYLTLKPLRSLSSSAAVVRIALQRELSTLQFTTPLTLLLMFLPLTAAAAAAAVLLLLEPFCNSLQHSVIVISLQV
jgi:hypothetical protein